MSILIEDPELEVKIRTEADRLGVSSSVLASNIIESAFSEELYSSISSEKWIEGYFKWKMRHKIDECRKLLEFKDGTEDSRP